MTKQELELQTRVIKRWLHQGSKWVFVVQWLDTKYRADVRGSVPLSVWQDWSDPLETATEAMALAEGLAQKGHAFAADVVLAEYGS